MKALDLIGQTFGFLTVISRKQKHFKTRTRTFWECKCICGTTHEVEHGQLKSGKTKSCGCRSKGLISKALSKGGYRANFICVYHNIKNAGLNRGYSWEISEELFHSLSQQRCFYCDCVPNNISNTRKTCDVFFYSGLDRVDNSVGYTIDNVVPCCKFCNAGKSTDSQQSFFDRIRRICAKHDL